jgi:predicted metal-binding membrane protein
VTSVAAPQELPHPRFGTQRAVVLAIAAGWALALVAEIAGYGTIHHHAAVGAGLGALAGLALFLLAWQTMIAAMMLPSSMPLIRLFAVTSRNQPRPGLVMAVFLGGYAAVWTAFGALAFAADLGLARAADGSPWLRERSLLIAGGVLVLAGLFEFSGLKDRCLSKCRHPGGFLLTRYRRGLGPGFRLGVAHGLFCLGCCWALMLVMFAVGTAALWLMAALTAVMFYEKTGRHGAMFARYLGVGLLTIGGLAVLTGLLVAPAGHVHALAGFCGLAREVATIAL